MSNYDKLVAINMAVCEHLKCGEFYYSDGEWLYLMENGEIIMEFSHPEYVAKVVFENCGDPIKVFEIATGLRIFTDSSGKKIYVPAVEKVYNGEDKGLEGAIIKFLLDLLSC